MENLDKLTAAGLPIYDLNLENLERKDWYNAIETLGCQPPPLTLSCQVQDRSGHARTMAGYSQDPRQLMHPAHSTLRRHFLGTTLHHHPQPGLGQGPR